MSKWLIMKIPGTTKVQLSLLMILAISSVTSTSLLINQQVKNTSVGNTLCRNGNLEEGNGVLLLRAIGNATMDPVQNSRRTLSYMEENPSAERF